jgi:hypothetical protein
MKPKQIGGKQQGTWRQADQCYRGELAGTGIISLTKSYVTCTDIPIWMPQPWDWTRTALKMVARKTHHHRRSYDYGRVTIFASHHH